MPNNKAVKPLTILPFKKGGALGEIYQTMELRMAHLVRTEDLDTFQQITPLVKCRDFLCDCYSASNQKFDFSIYGMKWDGTERDPSWNNPKLLLQFPNLNAKLNFENNLWMLQDIEIINQYGKDMIFPVKDDLKIAIFGGASWIDNVLKFSLYTFLLRLLCYPLEKGLSSSEVEGSDGTYLKSINKAAFSKVLNDLSLLDTEEWNGLSFKEHGVSAVHHNSGFISVFGTHSEINKDTVRKNKHWQLMKNRGLKLCLA